MMYLLQLAILWGFCSAIIGVGVFDYLATDDTPLSPMFRFLRDWQDKGGRRSWIASPIGGCAICTSGQIAFWSMLMIVPLRMSVSIVGSGWRIYPHFEFADDFAVSFWIHTLAACSAITFALALTSLHRWLKNRI